MVPSPACGRGWRETPGEGLRPFTRALPCPSPARGRGEAVSYKLRKNFRMSATSASGSSIGAKCPPLANFV
ncbi:MAG: hypothetical protein K0Q76_3163 [Panacagrimonas sp.]|nr:hypothetical protein [Panacagrimonas sp.]